MNNLKNNLEIKPQKPPPLRIPHHSNPHNEETIWKSYTKDLIQ